MNIKFVLLYVFISLLSCKKNISVNNLNGDKIGCFGHAGMGSRSVYPANTMESFKTCLNNGADGTEMDLQVTRDGVLVIFHNEDLSSVTACGGIIRDLNWSEIDACRINSPVFKHLNVISFEEFIQKIRNPIVTSLRLIASSQAEPTMMENTIDGLRHPLCKHP